MKIQSIQQLDQYYERYDLEIKDTHNFIVEDVVVHNTNTRAGYLPEMNGLVLGSREHIIFKDGICNRNLYGFHDYALTNLLDKLRDNSKYHNHILYGEFFGDGVQKGIKYCNGKQFKVFDVRSPDGNFLNWNEVQEICLALDIPTVPVIATGKITLEYLESIRDNLSQVSIQNGFPEETNTWEGIVIKPLVMRRDHHGEWMMAKYKSEKWAENCKAPKPKSLSPEKMALHEAAKQFAEENVTQGRVATITDHITRDGNTDLSMKRTAEFLRALVNDILAEHAILYAALESQEQKVYNQAISHAGSVLWKKQVLG